MFTIMPRKDVILFPFETFNRLLCVEYMAYSKQPGQKVLDRDAAAKLRRPKFSYSANLIIIGHGTGEGDDKEKICGDSPDEIMTMPDLAQLVVGMRIIRSYSNCIFLWSCESGVWGGAAEKLCHHLTSHGVYGVRVYGALRNTAPIQEQHLMVSDADDNDGTARRATWNDVLCYVGYSGGAQIVDP